nr:immunoglobulin heavy chain junction region [Macaca mulatta]
CAVGHSGTWISWNFAFW